MSRATPPPVLLHRCRRTLPSLTCALVLLACHPAPSLFAQFSSSKADVAPKIIEQPKSLTVEQGQTATFKVEIESDKDVKDQITYSTYRVKYGKPTYQWMRNGARVTGATAATLTLSKVQPAAAGTYQVIVSNDVGWVASSSVTLTVFVPIPATIITQPIGMTVTEGESASFTVSTFGTPAPTYRWRKNGNPIPGATTSTLTLASVQFDDAGNYDVLVSNSRNSIFSRAVPLRVIPVNTAPPLPPIGITAQPSSAAHNPGEPVVFTVAATGNTLAYQWKKNGAPLNGATAESLTLSFVTAADMGFYSVLIKSSEVSIESDLAVLTVTSPTVSRLINLSTRGHVPPGGSLTPGFTLRGTGATELLVRAVGPTLARFGVGGACIDPTLELIPAGESTPFFTNDDWSARADALRVAAATAAVGAFALDTGSTDAAVLASFDSAVQRNYTARVMPKHPDASGIVLAELYATGAANSPVQLAAVSTLGHAGTGERTLVSGFTIEGTAPKRLLIRAVGPGLDQFGVRDTLSDPRLTLVPAGETSAIAGNDNWESNAAVTRATAMAGAFPLVPGSNDAALVVLLPPGGYTVTLSGQDGATGIALMEIYDLDR